MSYICRFGVVDCPECLQEAREIQEAHERYLRRKAERSKPFNTPRLVYVKLTQASPDVSFADLMDRASKLVEPTTVYAKDTQVIEYVHVTLQTTTK